VRVLIVLYLSILIPISFHSGLDDASAEAAKNELPEVVQFKVAPGWCPSCRKTAYLFRCPNDDDHAGCIECMRNWLRNELALSLKFTPECRKCGESLEALLRVLLDKEKEEVLKNGQCVERETSEEDDDYGATSDSLLYDMASQ
jgi:hypothetical protein